MALETLHFTIGEDFGVMLTNIAQEHIQYNYNLQKGIDAIEQGLCGIPRDMALDVISGNKIIGVDGDNCYVTEWIDGVHDKLGYHKFNPSTWSEKEIDKLVNSGIELAELLDEYINENVGHFEIDFDSSSLMKYIFNGDDSDIFLEIEEEMESFRQLQIVVDSYLKKADTVLSCLKDLYQLSQTDECKGKCEWVIDIPPTLQVVFNIKMQIKELVAKKRSGYNRDNLVDRFNGSHADSLLDNFMDAQREIDKIEKDGIKPSNITENLNAYWLAPNGDAYGLNGEIANMLHNQIAGMLVDAGIVVVEDMDLGNPDSVMERQGWLKLHNGQVLGEHVYNDMLITQQQKDALIKYCEVQPKGLLCMNHLVMNQYISKARLEMTNLETLTNMLDIGMKKKDLLSKKKVNHQLKM